MQMTAPGILVDTYTWIEIFQDSPWGQKALACMERNSPVAVSVLTLYELQYRLTELSGREKTEALMGTILSQTKTIPVNGEIAMLAGSIKAARKKECRTMGAVDCVILATARVYGLKILSGDKHFAGLAENLDISVT
jgi:predicted nucleic acid-binding protein